MLHNIIPEADADGVVADNNSFLLTQIQGRLFNSSLTRYCNIKVRNIDWLQQSVISGYLLRRSYVAAKRSLRVSGAGEILRYR